MSGPERDVSLRPTRSADLDFVLALEQHPENRPFIGQWSRAEHEGAIARGDREHWVIEAPPGAAAGYLIAYDLRAVGLGVYVKRIVVGEKSRGLGRTALAAFVRRAREERAAPCVWLAVLGENLRAQRAYAAIGFRVAAVSADERQVYSEAVGGFSERSLVMVLGEKPGRRAGSPASPAAP